MITRNITASAARNLLSPLFTLHFADHVSWQRGVAICFMLVTLLACETTAPTRTTQAPVEVIEPAQSMQPASVSSAEYLARAQRSRGTVRNGLLLKAVDQMFVELDSRRSESSENSENSELLSNIFAIHQQLAAAELTASQQGILQLQKAQAAYLRKDSPESLRLLNNAPALLDPTRRIQALSLRSDALQQLGAELPSVLARIEALALMSSNSDEESSAALSLAAESQSLFRRLQQIPAPTLKRHLQAPVTPAVRGWLELTLLLQDATGISATQASASDLPDALAQWRQKWPEHPARRFANQRQNAGSSMTVVLPLNGPLAAAGSTIQHGVMAAWFASNERTRPDMQIIDSTAYGTEELVRTLQRLPTDFIIGPLQRDRVAAVNQAQLTGKTTLALNQLAAGERASDGFFHYALRSDANTTALLERARRAGWDRAIVIREDARWANRVAQPLIEGFSAWGEIIAEAALSDQEQTDETLQRVLALQPSSTRSDDIGALLGEEVNFEARRRQDVDVIFIIAAPIQARLIKTLLDYHYASDIPVLASSHINDGLTGGNAAEDLDGIEFCDIPWRIVPSKVHHSVQNSWGDANGPMAHFYALGVDAFLLLSRLPAMLDNDASLFGASGHLFIEDNQRVERNLHWAKFQDGAIKADY